MVTFEPIMPANLIKAEKINFTSKCCDWSPCPPIHIHSIFDIQGLLGVDEAVTVGDICEFDDDTPPAVHIGCDGFGWLRHVVVWSAGKKTNKVKATNCLSWTAVTVSLLDSLKITLCIRQNTPVISAHGPSSAQRGWILTPVWG